MIISNKAVFAIPNWASQLALLVKTMWSGEDGKCYFPYKPMATSVYWKEKAVRDWVAGRVISKFWLDDNNHNRITACASLIDKGGYWELGRFNSYSDNPKGVMLRLVQKLKDYADILRVPLVCETTQCHTSSQFIASQLGMRFAGYGFFKFIEQVPWDILYFDNHDTEDFVSYESGMINDLLGVLSYANQIERSRLVTIEDIISTERTSGFPPKKFHIYSKYLSNFERILAMNRGVLYNVG